MNTYVGWLNYTKQPSVKFQIKKYIGKIKNLLSRIYLWHEVVKTQVYRIKFTLEVQKNVKLLIQIFILLRYEAINSYQLEKPFISIEKIIYSKGNSKWDNDN